MIVKIVVTAIAITLLAMILKTDFKVGATLLSVVGCIIFFNLSVGLVSKISDEFSRIELSDGVNTECVKIIIKMLAVAYITSFGADICRDAGEKAIANAVESIGKLTMLTMSFPMLSSIFESIANMIG